MGATHFQMRRLPKVASEMALHVLAYNMERVMQPPHLKMSSNRTRLDSRTSAATMRQILARAIAHAIKMTIVRIFTQPGPEAVIKGVGSPRQPLDERDEIVFADSLEDQEGRRRLSGIGHEVRPSCPHRTRLAWLEAHVLLGILHEKLQLSLDHIERGLDVAVRVQRHFLLPTDLQLGDAKSRPRRMVGAALYFVQSACILHCRLTPGMFSTWTTSLHHKSFPLLPSQARRRLLFQSSAGPRRRHFVYTKGAIGQI